MGGRRDFVSVVALERPARVCAGCRGYSRLLLPLLLVAALGGAAGLGEVLLAGGLGLGRLACTGVRGEGARRVAVGTVAAGGGFDARTRLVPRLARFGQLPLEEVLALLALLRLPCLSSLVGRPALLEEVLPLLPRRLGPEGLAGHEVRHEGQLDHGGRGCRLHRYRARRGAERTALALRQRRGRRLRLRESRRGGCGHEQGLVRLRLQLGVHLRQDPEEHLLRCRRARPGPPVQVERFGEVAGRGDHRQAVDSEELAVDTDEPCDRDPAILDQRTNRTVDQRNLGETRHPRLLPLLSIL